MNECSFVGPHGLCEVLHEAERISLRWTFRNGLYELAHYTAGYAAFYGYHGETLPRSAGAWALRHYLIPVEREIAIVHLAAAYFSYAEIASFLARPIGEVSAIMEHHDYPLSTRAPQGSPAYRFREWAKSRQMHL